MFTEFRLVFKVGRKLMGGWEDGLTWLVQTLLKVTNAKVWASMVEGRSFFERRSGMKTAERRSWGRKASDSRWRNEVEGFEDLR